jgi:phosphoribosylanthranilate isomerase
MESPFRTRVKICCISSLEEARLAILFGADALGLDSGNPTLALKELGGTGRVHNWRVSQQIVA